MVEKGKTLVSTSPHCTQGSASAGEERMLDGGQEPPVASTIPPGGPERLILVSSCGAAQMPGCGIPTCLGLGYLCIQQWGAPVLEYPGVGGLGCKVLHSQCV